MKIKISNLTKSYGNISVLKNLNLELDDCQPWCLMSPSGSGKTTLLRLLLGLEQPNSGEICFLDYQINPRIPSHVSKRLPRFSAVFQENRLCEAFSPIDNVMIAAGPKARPDRIRKELSLLLPADSLDRPVCTFSGGMKRRTAICRAMAAPSQAVILDEPFTGLDEDTRNEVIHYVLERLEGRMLITATHHKEEADLLRGKIVNL